jgi:hypothetical protein
MAKTYRREALEKMLDSIIQTEQIRMDMANEVKAKIDERHRVFMYSSEELWAEKFEAMAKGVAIAAEKVRQFLDK